MAKKTFRKCIFMQESFSYCRINQPFKGIAERNIFHILPIFLIIPVYTYLRYLLVYDGRYVHTKSVLGVLSIWKTQEEYIAEYCLWHLACWSLLWLLQV